MTHYSCVRYWELALLWAYYIHLLVLILTTGCLWSVVIRMWERATYVSLAHLEDALKDISVWAQIGHFYYIDTTAIMDSGPWAEGCMGLRLECLNCLRSCWALDRWEWRIELLWIKCLLWQQPEELTAAVAMAFRNAFSNPVWSDLFCSFNWDCLHVVKSPSPKKPPIIQPVFNWWWFT